MKWIFQKGKMAILEESGDVMILELGEGSILSPKKNKADLNEIFWIILNWSQENSGRKDTMKNLVELRWRLTAKVFLLMWGEDCNLGFVKTQPLPHPGDLQIDINILNKNCLNIAITMKLIRANPLPLQTLCADKICELVKKEEEIDILGLPKAMLPKLKEWVVWKNTNVHNIECVRVKDDKNTDEGPVWNYRTSLKIFAKEYQRIGGDYSKIREERLKFLDELEEYMRNMQRRVQFKVEIETNGINGAKRSRRDLNEMLSQEENEAFSEITEEELIEEEPGEIPWSRERACCKLRRRWREYS